MGATMLPLFLPLSASLQKHMSGVTGQGRGAPLLIGLFIAGQRGEGKKKKGGQ